jgi:cyclophilin family peptidyl-prolyl cis-trans isomerase
MNTNAALVTLAVVIVVGAGVYFGFNAMNNNNQPTDNNGQMTQPTPVPTPEPTPAQEETAPKSAVVRFETTEGNFKITLDGVTAPKTVNNFIKLANEKYYDGMKFHRIIDGFMVQSGDPNSRGDDPTEWGIGGPGYTVPAEISLKADEGAIGMASTRAKGPSSGSQFFIVLAESQNNHLSLDGNYTFFGKVSEGMDVVKKIGKTPVEPSPNNPMEQSLPLKNVIINKVIVEKTE